jgi:hypothetical protein
MGGVVSWGWKRGGRSLGRVLRAEASQDRIEDLEHLERRTHLRRAWRWGDGRACISTQPCQDLSGAVLTFVHKIP